MPSLLAAWGISACISVASIGYVVLLGKTGLMNRLLLRKIMHIGTGPTCVLCWWLFPDSPWSPYVASSVIGALTIFFAMVGSGIVKAGSLVDVVSRSGRASELLVGPILYGLVHVLAAVLFWTHSPIGIVSIITLCSGDGVADIVGRRMGKTNPLPWNASKSWAGSIAFFLVGYCSCIGFGNLLFSWGMLDPKFEAGFGWNCSVVVLVAALVESFPLGAIDNFTVFAACAICGKMLW